MTDAPRGRAPARASHAPRAPRVARIAALALLAMTFGDAAGAQVTQQEQSIMWRLDQQSRIQIDVLLDSATRLGFPTELLYAKTLEGISKGASSRRIVDIVRKYFGLMREARSALGGAYTTDELSAASGALLAGVEREEIARLRKSRGGKSISVPLVLLADLVQRGVPPQDASTTMVQLSQRGALDSELQGLWLRVNQDIVSGVPPAAALQRWAREYPGSGAPGTRLPPGTAPPTTTAPRAPEPSSTTPP